jgi:uncharacterized protein
MPFVDSANRIAARLAVGLIRLYQRFISPFTGPSCRFYPSCSDYSLLAITRYGVMRGIGKTVLRLAKCHPFHPGGYDPLP